jgi:HD superfamily phosphohydrolase
MFNQKTIINEPLYPLIQPHKWEIELFNSNPVRRLKQLAHFGAGSIVSSVVHTRFEHTVGVWKLAAYFFPDDVLLRVAAILHDVGHLPFSHSVERTLGFNHHHITKQLIQEEEISSILNKARIIPSEIIDFLNKPSVLTGKTNILGIDHLDSFLRDTYMAGEIELLPKNLLSKIRCTSKGIETDKDTGLYLLKLIKKDHALFFITFYGCNR